MSKFYLNLSILTIAAVAFSLSPFATQTKSDIPDTPKAEAESKPASAPAEEKPKSEIVVRTTCIVAKGRANNV